MVGKQASKYGATQMGFWNGKTAEMEQEEKEEKEEIQREENDYDLLYTLEKKVNTILIDKDREINLLKAELHSNTQFLHQIILELIARQPVTSTLRSSSVPLNSSVKMKNDDGSTVGPVRKLP